MKGIGYEHTVVDTNTTILTTAGTLYGVCVISETTGDVAAVIQDGSGGNSVLGAKVSGGTKNAASEFCDGVACGSGIHVNAAVCTSGADEIIVFYGP